MAKADLSERAIEAGAKFLAKLDEFGLRPEAAAWLYAHHLDEWRYIVATAAVDVVGRRKLYGDIIDIFRIVDFGEELTDADVHLVSPNEYWYQAMEGNARFEGGVAKVRNCNFGSIVLDGYIYRLHAPQKSVDAKKRSNAFSKKVKKALASAGV